MVWTRRGNLSKSMNDCRRNQVLCALLIVLCVLRSDTNNTLSLSAWDPLLWENALLSGISNDCQDGFFRDMENRGMGGISNDCQDAILLLRRHVIIVRGLGVPSHRPLVLRTSMNFFGRENGWPIILQKEEYGTLCNTHRKIANSTPYCFLPKKKECTEDWRVSKIVRIVCIHVSMLVGILFISTE